ncbi:MAG: rimK [Candidatus Midichloriaceae bacterium]|jgi:glutathione synthase|nr:rimK [Candidatus Midichloriaceae bacterium]
MERIVALQIDHIDSLNYESDTSIFLAEELERRGYKIFYYTPAELTFDTHLSARGTFVSFTNGFYRKIGDDVKLDLARASIVMIRQNPPFNQQYLTNTYLLDLLPKSTITLNNPEAIRRFPEKLSALHFPDFIPKTMVSSNYENLKAFYKAVGKAVLKPIYGFGGQDVALIDSEQKFQDLVPLYLDKFGECILQEYLPSVKTQGDKRVLIAGGKVVGALSRMPQEGNFIANMAAGGKPSVTTLTGAELDISNKVAKHLSEQGIFLAGVDLIDSKLIEINVTSPTGFKVFSKISGERTDKLIIDMLLK